MREFIICLYISLIGFILGMGCLTTLQHINKLHSENNAIRYEVSKTENEVKELKKQLQITNDICSKIKSGEW